MKAKIFLSNRKSVKILKRTTFLLVSKVHLYYFYTIWMSLSQAFLPGTSLEPTVVPTAQASSFTLLYFPYYV